MKEKADIHIKHKTYLGFKKGKSFFIGWFLLGSFGLLGQSKFYQISAGQIDFKSNAPLELIEAKSGNLEGILNLSENTFAFVLDINSFEGFNSPLQKEHFRENYLETNLYPKATFVGKIIEKEQFEADGYYNVRAKGKLTIHGVDQERIIKSRLRKKGDQFQIDSYFTILLKDHKIKIPRLVYQKIAEEIEVKMTAVLEPRVEK